MINWCYTHNRVASNCQPAILSGEICDTDESRRDPIVVISVERIDPVIGSDDPMPIKPTEEDVKRMNSFEVSAYMDDSLS